MAKAETLGDPNELINSSSGAIIQVSSDYKKGIRYSAILNLQSSDGVGIKVLTENSIEPGNLLNAKLIVVMRALLLTNVGTT